MKAVAQPTGKLLKNPGAFWQKQGALVALVLLIIFASIRYETFLAPVNILNILKQNSMIGMVALGMTFVILLKGIDLSVGSLLAFGGIMAATLSPYGIAVAVVVPIVLTTLLGCLNGVIIAKLRMEPFIVTLAMMIGVRGFIYAFTKEKTVSVDGRYQQFFIDLGNGAFIGIPNPVWIFFITLAVLSFVLHQTKFGRNVYAIGGNEDATRLMGIRVDRMKIMVYALSGALAGFTGIILMGRLGGAAQPVAGDAWELDAIAAVVIGGTLLTGGRGGVFGTFVGVMLLGVVLNVINLQGTLDSWWQPVIRGAFLIIIVIIQAQLQKQQNSGNKGRKQE
ncbi:ABC transporter permease [Ectobacillus ponti]|uniref:ABC transporter permease n=1 Tax=Ectobacillus ponti TaxID=2961894 RepID=A0AA41XB28_9BACI|nr:ABC transporter permease [Ectobacillus ponti]MCP8969675.1 ABC transporter permease [Ectobacillus ponti]